MLTAADMAECRWLKPELVAQIEFVEWTEANHLRHARFVGLREGNNPKNVYREIPMSALKPPKFGGQRKL
jgi:bifunctional non-homologous end joining protein LigD